MQYYPIFLDIKGRPVLVIGGGNIALEKIQNLLKAGAAITVISPEISPSIRRFNRRLTLIEREFEMGDISTAYILIFAATGDSELNSRVSKYCRDQRILCNTVDDPAYCHYIIPALVRRGKLTIAISTSGVSPLLAKTIKNKLKSIIGPEYTVLTRLMARYRQWVKDRYQTFAERLTFWEHFLRSNPLQKIRQGQLPQIESVAQSGHVTFVGAGPGDPGLITLKGMEALQNATVVLLDYLVHPDLLKYCQATAILIRVGKSRGFHSKKQSEINQLLVEYAAAGNSVVRLKGGDPVIFGRLGEEMEVLRSHGIAYSVVPGITSATAAPIYSGIPLTYREVSRSVAFVTASTFTNIDELGDIHIPSCDTIVFMMPLNHLDALVRRVAASNRFHLGTPAAIIANGTT